MSLNLVRVVNSFLCLLYGLIFYLAEFSVDKLNHDSNLNILNEKW